MWENPTISYIHPSIVAGFAGVCVRQSAHAHAIDVIIFLLFECAYNVSCVCVCRGGVMNNFFQLKQLQAVTNEDRTAMMEMVQTKAEDLLRREEEGRTMRVLYESEVLLYSGFTVISSSGAGGMLLMKMKLVNRRKRSLSDISNLIIEFCFLFLFLSLVFFFSSYLSLSPPLSLSLSFSRFSPPCGIMFLFLFFFLSFMDFQVTKGKNKLRMMETMIRLVAEASPPIDALDKDELVLHMSAMYKVNDTETKQPSKEEK